MRRQRDGEGGNPGAASASAEPRGQGLRSATAVPSQHGFFTQSVRLTQRTLYYTMALFVGGREVGDSTSWPLTL